MSEASAQRTCIEGFLELLRRGGAEVVDVESQLERATRKKVGSTDEEVVDWLRRHEFTKKEGEAIIRTAEVEEGGARTVWELVNGGTAVARAIPYNDDRVLMEKRVSRLLKAAG